MPELHPNLKHIENSLKVLHELHQDHTVTLNFPSSHIDNSTAILKKIERGFSITFDVPCRQFNLRDDITDIGWEFGEYKMWTEKIFPVATDFNTVTAIVSDFKTGDFNLQKEGYFRLIIPFPGDLQLNLYLTLSVYSTHYKELNRNARGCVRASVNNIELDMYIFRPEPIEMAYLVIDSTKPMVYDDFSKITFAIAVSAGYVTGYLVQGEGYFFSYADSSMDMPIGTRYTELRSTVKSLFSPIISNVYSIVQDSAIVEVEKDDLRPLTKDEFSTLCQQAFSSQRLAAILLLIMEATVATQVLMPAAFTVALEGMTDIIMKDAPEKFIPIPDRIMAKDFRRDLMEVLSRYEEKISDFGIDTLTKKISAINTPTNADQLYKPFEVLGFNLEEVDKEAIAHRNDFMHGRITLLEADEDGMETSQFEEPFRHLHYTALRIYTLLAVLILRRIGFNGKIINHPKVQEQVRGIPVNEPYFRPIHNIPCGRLKKKNRNS